MSNKRGGHLYWL